MIKVVCFSGGKDSTAMLIHLLENDFQVDDVLYVSMGSWMWSGHLEHIRQVEDTLGVKITVLDVEDEIIKGFQRWGFPSWLNRWCTGIKRESMRKFLHTKYSKSLERERALYNTLDILLMRLKEQVKNYSPLMMLNIL